MSANFTPDKNTIAPLKPFRFWCQKILPLVYDDSLSYYELLCKVVDYLNKTMEDVDLLSEDVSNMFTAYGQLENYVNIEIKDIKDWTEEHVGELESFVNNYFDNLNVQTEINNKLDAMVLDGTLTTLVYNAFHVEAITTVQSDVAAWIAANLSQETGYVIDKSLSVSDAAADAAVVGGYIDYIKEYIGVYDDSILTVDNSYIDYDGYSGTSNNFHRSAPIEIPTGIEKLLITKAGILANATGCVVAFFTNDTITHGNFISGVGTDTGITPDDAVEVTIPANAKFMVFSGRKLNDFEVSYYVINATDKLMETKHDVDLVVNGVLVNYVSGLITNDGQITTGNNNNFYSSEIKKAEFETLHITAKDGYIFSLCSYDDGNFVSRSGWYTHSNGEIVITNNYDYRINLATAASGTGKTIDEMLANYIIHVNGNDLPSIRRMIEDQPGTVWLSKISACQASGKVIHFSFDDVYEVLFELITDTPISIWDNTTMAALKAVHDATGACFTLNCFNECSDEPTYDISNMPNTWTSEWQAAKSWLKFAFHANDDTTTYATDTTAAVDYTKFVNAVYAFTEDYECIDTVARLGFFAGTLEQVKAIKELPHGIIGLLAADDSRIPYYLDQTETDQINNHGRYYDVNNELFFIKSLPRIDSTLSADEIAYIESVTNIADKYIEVFSHSMDTDRLSRIQTVSTWANNHGFTNGFLCDYFK